MEQNSWDNPIEVLTRAREAQKLGNSEMAYQLFVRSSELAPNNVAGWRGRAETGTHPDEALISWGYAAALAPNDAQLGQELDMSVNQRVESSASRDVPTLLALGQELARVGLTSDARTLLHRAAELDRSSSDSWVWLAATEEDPKLAETDLQQVLACNPQDPRALAGLEALGATAKHVKVEPTARAAPQEDQLARLMREGEEALAKGDKLTAHEFFIVASSLANNDPIPWMRRAETTEDIDEALMCYDQALVAKSDLQEARDRRTTLQLKKARLGDENTAAGFSPAVGSEVELKTENAITPGLSEHLTRIEIWIGVLLVLLFTAGLIILLTR